MAEVCKHNWKAREYEAADGACPLCQAAEIERLRAALEEIDRVAVAKLRGAAPRMQRTARAALRAC